MIAIVFVLLMFVIFVLFATWIGKDIGKSHGKSHEPESIPIPIPRIIIQTWKTITLPLPLQQLQQKVRKHNPTYKYMFFDDVDVDRFVQTHYFEYWDTFQRLTPRIKQIDFFRYLAVRHYGGFYLDMDMEVNGSLESIRNHGVGAAAVFPLEDSRNTDDVLQRNGISYLVGNYAFAAVQGSAAIQAIIDGIHHGVIPPHDIPRNSLFKEVLYTTGPVLVTYVLHGRKDVRVIQSTKYPESGFGEVARHLLMHSWVDEKGRVKTPFLKNKKTRAHT